MVEWITDMAQFGRLAASWEALLPRIAHPFDLHDWYSAWWRAFGAPGKLGVLTLEREGALAAAFPLYRPQSGHLHGLANVHSPMFRPLAVDEESMRELIDEALRDPVKELTIPMLPSDDDSLGLLEAGIGSARKLSIVEPGPVSPIVSTTGDLEAWRKEKSASWKARLARYRRKMEREHEASFELVTAPDDLDRWLEQGFQVEASGWKGQAGTAIASAEDTQAFYRDIARRFHERDELRLSRLTLDGQVVAFSFCLLGGNRLYSLKTGYDESWKKLVPGLVLQLSIVERCFELGLDAYELLGETSDWKQKFASSSRSYTRLRVYPRTVPGRARHAYRARLRPQLRKAADRIDHQRRS